LEAISLSTLAKENNISKAAIFHHFASREAMIGNCSTIANTLAYQQMATISLTGKPSEVLRRAMDHWHDLYANAPMRHSTASSNRGTDAPGGESNTNDLGRDASRPSGILLESLSESSRLIIEDLDLAVLTFSSVVQQFLRRVLLDETEGVEWEEERFIQSFCALYQGT
jgi:AcrR family transcriptional regulator